MTNSVQNPHRASGTFEFFSYRGTFNYPQTLDSAHPGNNSSVPVTPVADSFARATRELSAQRLRLATAERTSRPLSGYSQNPSQLDTTRTPSVSACAPSAVNQGLSKPEEGKASRPSSYITSSITYTYTQPNGSTLTLQAQPKIVAKAQTIQPSSKQRSGTHVNAPHVQGTPKRAGAPQQQQQQQQQQHRPKGFSPSDQASSRGMKAAERCKQLERTLREVQELLRDRDREIAQLKKERDRLLTEREHDKKVMREREQMRARERNMEQVREKEREKEREQEKQKELERQREREKERERERERQQEREQEERQRRSSHSSSFRRARSQTPTSPVHLSYSPHVDLEQAAHLRSLDVFLTKTDGWSGAQVIQAVEDLNAEINQFAASAAEVCVFERQQLPPSSRRSRNSRYGRGGHYGPEGRILKGSLMTPEEAAEIAPWLGASFAKILVTRDHEQDPVLVQLALQASIATCCARSLSLFCVGFPSKLDGLLSRVYSHMQKFEPQPTSSRWRALTHRSIRSLYPGLEEYATSELITTMMRWSGIVFTMTGCRLPSASTKDKENAPASLRAQLRRVAEAVFNLARITREEILSTNFEVVLAESGYPFVDTSMTSALDEYCHGGGDGKVSQGSVLCTTELGLRCTTKKSKTAVVSEGDEPFERRMLLRPKVVLDSTVDALDRE